MAGDRVIGPGRGDGWRVRRRQDGQNVGQVANHGADVPIHRQGDRRMPGELLGQLGVNGPALCIASAGQELRRRGFPRQGVVAPVLGVGSFHGHRRRAESSLNDPHVGERNSAARSPVSTASR